MWLWSWVGGISAAEGEVRTSATVVKTLSKEQCSGGGAERNTGRESSQPVEAWTDEETRSNCDSAMVAIGKQGRSRGQGLHLQSLRADQDFRRNDFKVCTPRPSRCWFPGDWAAWHLRLPQEAAMGQRGGCLRGAVGGQRKSPPLPESLVATGSLPTHFPHMPCGDTLGRNFLLRTVP